MSKVREWFNKGWATIAANGRFGMKQLQTLVMSEYAGPTPNEPGMFATPTQALITEQLEPTGMTYEQFQQQQSEAAGVTEKGEQQKQQQRVKQKDGPEVG